MKYFLPCVLALGADGVSASELDWTLSFGGHDFQVQSSDTFGAHAGIGLDYLTEGGIALHGSFDTFVDRDKDKLDPDHIPIWFQSSYFARGKWLALSPHLTLDWQLDLRGKRNTVSSVEKQIKLYPSLLLDYARPAFGATAQLGMGYYFLEIDDDVPKERGYERGEFGNDASAWMSDVGAYVMLAPGWKLSGGVEYWADGSDTLETRYRGRLDINTPGLYQQSVLTFSVEQTDYNLDHYDKWPKDSEDYLPILPWDSDTLYRVYLTVPW
ncbi:hypothetical protein KJI95_04250 [Shewanella sp. JM162201]|uniref:Nucleoside-specific outer membrane channel protein Tsx n=1 Tax=Shewanella jiangmenensis TaxID=2837387 RepID=A0ABS5UZT8_9GAMM|nr:hypothetical protein [Shewanella jiangmenensis]MBT1443737.1 hypothetical protein [Shewanella jiangmenensis]